MLTYKQVAIISLAAFVGVTGTGCIVQDYIDSVDGAYLGISCELDAMFDVQNCRPKFKFLRKRSSSTPANLGSFTLQFSSAGATIATLPSTVDVTLSNNGVPLAVQTFSLQAVSGSEVKLADPVSAQNWINSYGQAIGEIEYVTNNLVAQPAEGQNTIGAGVVAVGTVVASASYSFSHHRAPQVNPTAQ